MSNEFAHVSVGDQLSRADWESVTNHAANGQTTGDMLWFNGTSWVRKALGMSATTGVGRESTVVVASNGSSATEKAQADLVADGVSDEVTLLQSITDAGNSGTRRGVRWIGEFSLGGLLDLPALQDFFIDARGAKLLGPIRLDSMMDVKIDIGVVYNSDATYPVVEFKPVSDSEIEDPAIDAYGFVYNYVRINSIAGPGATGGVYDPGSIGMKMNVASGKNIMGNRIEVLEMNGVETLFSAPTPGGYIAANDIRFRAMVACDNAFIEGTAGQPAGRCYGNRFDIGLIVAPTLTGITMYGNHNVYHVGFYDTVPAGKTVTFGNSADKNIVYTTPKIDDYGYTDSSTAKTNMIFGSNIRPVFATGAGHTVDELITVLQDMNLVRQS